jgi:hypothetical protein
MTSIRIHGNSTVLIRPGRQRVSWQYSHADSSFVSPPPSEVQVNYRIWDTIHSDGVLAGILLLAVCRGLGTVGGLIRVVSPLVGPVSPQNSPTDL